MGNHGGSPPNLGLKETTPTPGKTRHKRLHTTHLHTMHIHNKWQDSTQQITTHPIPRLCTKIQQMNQVEGEGGLSP